MKKAALLILMASCLFVVPSCKKFIDKQKENYLLNIITNGRWYLDSYIEDGVDQTALFTGYEFQFYKDEKVDAINGASVTSGTWKADISNLTFTGAFPTGMEPLQRLNHVWKITDPYEDAVYAQVRTSTGITTILLRKK